MIHGQDKISKKILKSLKKNKASDPWGMKNKIFRPENPEKDLIKSLLILMNGIKSNLIIPDFLIH